MRRWISFMVVLAMFAPSAASAAEGAMATWLSPQSGDIVSGGKVEVAIGYNTQSKLKVSSVELYVDGQFLMRKILGSPQARGVCSFYWDTTRVEQGTHDLVVKVFAGDQMISKIYGTGTVGPNGTSRGLLDVRPPVVTFSNIRAGDVLKGTSTVKLNAADDSGQSPMVSLLVDDVLKLLKNTPPYSYDLDTTTYADGDHSLKTYAYDGAGNRSDPAVVKVAFRNGVEKPVVTTLSVNHESGPAVPEATLSKVTPPSVNVDAKPAIRTSAARAETRIDVSSSSVAPVVAKPAPKPVVVAAAPKPAPSPKIAMAAPKLEAKLKVVSAASNPELKTVRVAPAPDSRIAAAVKPNIRIESAPAKPAAAALTTKPVRMASASVPADVRKEIAKPTLAASSSVAKPVVAGSPRTSGVHTASASKLPQAKQSLTSAPKIASTARSAAPSVVETKSTAPKQALSAPMQSGVTRMAMASSTTALRSATQSAISGSALSTAPKIIDEPVVSSAKNVPVDHSAALKTESAGPAASSASAAKPLVVAPSKLSKSDLKRVQVALAPDIRSAAQRTCPSAAIACPPPVVKSSKAKLEKITVPASGKIKARDFFEKMGGVLFWDASTHTVTACVDGMVLEMRIGSKAAKVNGHDFQMTTAPYLVQDRTIFEAGTFTQACSLLDSLKMVGKAEID